MKKFTKILVSVCVAIMMIAVACKKDEPSPTPPATTPTTTPPVVTKSTAKDITLFLVFIFRNNLSKPLWVEKTPTTACVSNSLIKKMNVYIIDIQCITTLKNS